MTLRRGKGVEYRQGPVKATGPAPPPGSSQLPEAQWGDSPPGPPFFRSVSPRAGNPGHAGAAVSAYPDRPNSRPNIPSSIAAGCPRVQPDGMTFPGHHRGGLSGDAGVSQALAAGGPRPGDRTGPHPHPDRR